MIKLVPKVQETANQQFNMRHFIHRKASNTLLYLTLYQHEIPKEVSMIRVFQRSTAANCPVLLAHGLRGQKQSEKPLIF